MGRPSKHTKDTNRQVQKLSAMGLTDKQMAEVLGIAEHTLNEWKKKYPEFHQSLKDGKDIADKRVELSLYQRATGYEHDEDWVGHFRGEPVVVKTIKHYPPDTTACIFWLKNRKPEQWRDRQELTGAGGGPIQIEDMAEALAKVYGRPK